MPPHRRAHRDQLGRRSGGSTRRASAAGPPGAHRLPAGRFPPPYLIPAVRASLYETRFFHVRPHGAYTPNLIGTGDARQRRRSRGGTGRAGSAWSSNAPASSPATANGDIDIHHRALAILATGLRGYFARLRSYRRAVLFPT